MERIALDGELAHLGLLDADAFRVGALVEGALDGEAGLGCGPADQLDHRGPALQRLAAPVLRDVTEQPVLDLVPFRGSGRIVVDMKREAALVDDFKERGINVVEVDKADFEKTVLEKVTFEEFGYDKADWEAIRAIK